MAVLTITTTGAQDARLVVAFKRHLNLAQNATAAEIKADIIRYLRAVVVNAEAEAAREALEAPAPFDPA